MALTAHERQRLRQWKQQASREPQFEGERECTRCCIVKPLTEFYPHRGGKYGRNSRCKSCSAITVRVHNLQVEYGLSLAEYEQLVAKGCAICGSPGTRNSNQRQLSVDHDHSCCPGKRSCGRCVRGVLCTTCNFLLGCARDDPGILQRASDYLS